MPLLFMWILPVICGLVGQRSLPPPSVFLILGQWMLVEPMLPPCTLTLTAIFGLARLPSLPPPSPFLMLACLLQPRPRSLARSRQPVERSVASLSARQTSLLPPAEILLSYQAEPRPFLRVQLALL